MAEDTPSWWHTRAIQEGNLLFEYFPRNATPYAVLRVSCGTGTQAGEGTFSTTELSLQHQISANDVINLLSSSTASTALRNHELTVRAMGHGALVLPLRHAIPSSAFVSRVMGYLAHVQADLRAEEAAVARLRSKRAALVDRVEQMAKEKVSDDRHVREGLPVLMSEKWKYFNR